MKGSSSVDGVVLQGLAVVNNVVGRLVVATVDLKSEEWRCLPLVYFGRTLLNGMGVGAWINERLVLVEGSEDSVVEASAVAESESSRHFWVQVLYLDKRSHSNIMRPGL